MSAPNPSNIVSATSGWFAVLFPVFTLLLGFAIKFVSDWVQHKRDLERDRETRREVRHDLLAVEPQEFDAYAAVIDPAKILVLPPQGRYSGLLTSLRCFSR
jgi:hypothetical protein